MRAAALGALLAGLVSQSAHAIILNGIGDPERNTTPPAGTLKDSGWQYQGQWGGVLGTTIAPQYFIAARHVGGSPGDRFVFGDVPYKTTSFWDDADSDLRIWKVDGTFSRWAPLYPLNDEVGKSFVVIGRGTQRGEPVMVSVTRTIYTTNVVNLKTLGISQKEAKRAFPEATFSGNIMTVITQSKVTDSACIGWKFGVADGRMRWGENQVAAAGAFLMASFDAAGGNNEAYLSWDDSSGAAFIRVNGGWALAGLNYGIEGPFSFTATDPGFFGALTDKSGLYQGGYLWPNDGQPHPAYFFLTRISTRLAWIQSIIGP